MLSNNSKKISLFVPTLCGGGAERVMVNLAASFSERGFKVDMVLSTAKGPYLSDVPHEVQVVDLSARRVLTSLPKLVGYLRREQPYVILSAMDHANIIAIWAALLARMRTRVVVSVHNTLSRARNKSLLRSWFMFMLIRKFYPFANKVVIVSEEAKEDFLKLTGLPPRHVRVIYNPVVTKRLYDKAKQPIKHPWFTDGQLPVILGIGSLTKQKDFPTLIRAFSIVQVKHPARLLILGEGEERERLESLISELAIDNVVSLAGFVENPYAYIANASVFVLSSVWEGLPTVLIEALAIGTPIVSTDCKSGPREILDNGRYGRLTPVSDINALAVNILDVLRQEKNHDVSGESVIKFTADTSVKQYLQVLLD